MSLVKILFVCKGNICRSPTAHGIFRDIVKQNGLHETILISSAGTCSRKWGHEGDYADIRSVEMAKKYDCDLSDLISEQLEEFHFNDYDYVLVMDQENIDTIKQMFPRADFSKVSKILDYAPTISLTDVPDPYYENNFEKVFLMLDTACHEFFEKIKKEHNL
ncbi:low molecular weight protein-tyrosine-phosphatase [Allofrancisella frigidaquae]|uniref:protein-tyrosine-phosphatase n=1 Tax=Allofrancisella frigidaquae TaxID=1085644 RepID=A0A6M3HX73_9GAMM|nr:low molecular weight protein-tyrosine-phosphatase [Allofrancisella frigidaquae]QIV94701.1 low molecular weight phosphotyrosine protein phosphatase [Allofrancisella frigidaquae]